VVNATADSRSLLSADLAQLQGLLLFRFRLNEGWFLSLKAKSPRRDWTSFQ